jgi:hypothetical protein
MPQTLDIKSLAHFHHQWRRLVAPLMKITITVSIAEADAVESSVVSRADLRNLGSNSSKRASNHNSSQ